MQLNNNPTNGTIQREYNSIDWERGRKAWVDITIAH